MSKNILYTAAAFSLALFLLLTGCATVDQSSSSLTRSSELQSRYPRSDGQLALQRLTAWSGAVGIKTSFPHEVTIFVHPAYSVFLRDAAKDSPSSVKYELLKKQFEDEALSIAGVAASGKILILVIPGNFMTDSSAPLSYVSYLNTVTAGGPSVYYVLSETSSSGSLPTNDMVNLYQFLQAMNVAKVMVGGGYIGRCQREFYNQLTTYMDKSRAFIVPEISTISVDDVSEGEALQILASLEQQDYAPVKAFIDKKIGGTANILSIPPKRDM